MALNSKVLDSAVKVGLTVWKGFKTMSNDPKMPRVLKAIGTHNGVFHCDEALACFMLKQLPEYEDAVVKRTRDPKILETCDVVVDVGGVYDHEKKLYDHHQRSFNETLYTVMGKLAKNRTIKLSSAGLIYAHYGPEVIQHILRKKQVHVDPDAIPTLFLVIYDNFVEEIDGIDNGVPMCSDGKPEYRINTHLSARVKKLNPAWNSTETDIDKLFDRAVDLVGEEFVDKVLEVTTIWWPGREIVKSAIKTRLMIHESGAIIELTERCPWSEHLLKLESDLGLENQIKFVVFQDSSDSWRVQGVPMTPDSFICRVFLKEKWRGVRDSDLSNISGIKDCIFCHTTGFIGGNRTRAGAIKMAVESLEV